MKQEQFEQIDAYFTGQLQPEDQQAFEKQLATDEEFRRAVEDYRILYRGFYLKRMEGYLTELEALNQAQPPVTESQAALAPPQRRLQRLLLPLTFAAGFLLLAVVSLRLLATAHFAALAKEQFEVAELQPLIEMGEITTAQTSITNLFNAGAYEQVIQLLDTFPATNPNYLRVQYVLAQAYMQTGVYDKAADSYDYVVSHLFFESNSRLPDLDPEKIQWDRLLAFTADRRFNASFKEGLRKILTNPGHAYHQQAAELQQKTKGFWRWWA